MARASTLEKPKWKLHQLYNNPEHELFEDLIVEFVDIAGIEVDYYVRNETVSDFDTLYGEPAYQNTTYKNKKRTKMIYEPTEEPTLTTGFGINSEEIIQYSYMPKYIFNRDVAAANAAGSAVDAVGRIPKPGDVMKTIWNNRAYEVVDVHEEENIFQAKKQIWNFILRPYRFSEQSTSASAIHPFMREPTLPLRGTETTPLSAFGDNEYLENESDDIYDYGENSVDTSIYGY